MAQFQSLQLCTLIDILSDFTAHYAEMLTTGSTKENAECCKETIQLLQTEINYRNSKVNNQQKGTVYN
jgi:hypothetical protein